MKFRIAFSFSKSERKLRFRFWKWEVLSLDLKSHKDAYAAEIFEKDSSKAGFLSFKKENAKPEITKAEFGQLLIQALFYPDVEKKILKIWQKIISWSLKLFSIKFENLEIRGSLGDPFYDSVALGMSGGCYYPDWENESESFSAKGEAVFKTGFFKFLLFSIKVTYKNIALFLILWRGIRLAKKNPNGENLPPLRKWIFMRTKESM
jgi:hypothetical protein